MIIFNPKSRISISAFLLKLLVISFFIIQYSLITALSAPKIRLGIDDLIDNNFAPLTGKSIMLMTNLSGRTSTGELTVEAFLRTKKCKVIGLMVPEHGFYTTVQAGKDVIDETLFNLPVYSLFGKDKKPVFSQLKDCNALVIDIQDIGIRSYTYLSSVFRTMQACAEYKIPVFVLDRPNPLGGLIVDGNTIDSGMESFVGIIPIAYIHGCTMGELAEMINGEGWLSEKKENTLIKCNLTVIKMKNWQRSMVWEDTGLYWYPTSPNIPTVSSIRGAALIGIFGELGNVSVGIGTTLPFQYIGTPDIKTENIIKEIGNYKFLGMTLNQIRFTPAYGLFSGKICNGFFLTFNSDNSFRPYSSGIKLLSFLNKVHPGLFAKSRITQKSIQMFNKVTGTTEIIDALVNHKNFEEIQPIIKKGFDKYLSIRVKYLLYK